MESGVNFDCLSQIPEEIDLTVKEGKREKTNAEIEGEKHAREAAERHAREMLEDSDQEMQDKAKNDCIFNDDFIDRENSNYSNVNRRKIVDLSQFPLVVYKGPKDNDNTNDVESDLIEQFLMDEKETPIEDLESIVKNEIEYQFYLNKQAEINKQLCEGEKEEFDFVKVVPAIRHPGRLAYMFKGRRFNKQKLNVNDAVIKCYNKGFDLLFFLVFFFCFFFFVFYTIHFLWELKC